MIELLIGAGIGFGVFLCAFLGFRQGLRLGMKAAKGDTPPAIRSPVKIIAERAEGKENAEEALREAAAWQNLMAYEGMPQPPLGGKK